MPEISCGSKVVTPAGKKGKIKPNVLGEPAYIEIEDGTIAYLTGPFSIKNLEKVNDESEDECGTCGGSGEVMRVGEFLQDCPDCTDESEDEESFNPCDGRPLKSTDSEDYDEGDGGCG